MDDCVIRTLEVLRMLPDELEHLQERERRESIPVDWDPETNTCANVLPRTPRCLDPWEIQKAYHRPTLKDYYNLSGKGVFAELETVDRFGKIERAVKAILFEGAYVVFSTCKRCGWTETKWDGLWISGEDGPHEEGCSGKVWANAVRDVDSAARFSFTFSNVTGIHALDSLIQQKRDRLSLALSEFTDSKNKPKSRVERIKEEAKKSFESH